jgi:hypothetical protein
MQLTMGYIFYRAIFPTGIENTELNSPPLRGLGAWVPEGRGGGVRDKRVNGRTDFHNLTSMIRGRLQEKTVSGGFGYWITQKKLYKLR